MLEKIKKLLSFSPDYVISRLKKKLETEDMDLIEEILTPNNFDNINKKLFV